MLGAVCAALFTIAATRNPSRWGRAYRTSGWLVVAGLAAAGVVRILEASWGWAALDVACAAGFGHSLATNGGTR